MTNLVVLSSPQPLTIAVLFGAVILLLYLYRYYNSRKYKVGNAMNPHVFSDIAQVKDGDYVKIKGEVWAGGEKIKAPLSGRSCVYYHVLVERLTGSKNRHWVKEAEEEMMADVVLRCCDYYAVIEADSPLAHLIVDRQYSSGFLEDAAPQLEAFLKKNNSSSLNWIGMNHSMRYKEGILEHREEFAVAGIARWAPVSEVKFKLPVNEVLIISETEDKGVFLSDDPDLINAEEHTGS